MKYKFPKIESILDVLHAVDEKHFVVAKKNGYTVINYHYASPDVFPDVVNDGSEDDEIAKIRREFRGLIFDHKGKIIRRPFHKFFNVGERTDTQIGNIDVSQKHVIFDKLDGSMIAPFIVNDNVIWGTKMGETDVAKQVDPFVATNPDYEEYVRYSIGLGYTPIFEWCTRKQRIVLDYPQDQLLLTAVRHIENGHYLSADALREHNRKYGIPTCSHFDGVLSQDLMNDIRSSEEVEGYVIRFDDGHMVKIKSEWYVALHRVKSDIAYERGVVNLILNSNADDIKPLMPTDDLEELENYEISLLKELEKYCDSIYNTLKNTAARGMARKYFAVHHSTDMCSIKRKICFIFFDKADIVQKQEIKEALVNYITKQCNRANKFEMFRDNDMFKNIPVWRGIDINA